ncbi:hypothetical protein ACJMK2_035372 [Sinanodonta woodiana]|uniref:WD repeat-containing protein on Y chromosome n=1 Tax=Sinanodonta woodiana TaxID=1069815 RepID=A0ABD3WWI1_SINWO
MACSPSIKTQSAEHEKRRTILAGNVSHGSNRSANKAGIKSYLSAGHRGSGDRPITSNIKGKQTVQNIKEKRAAAAETKLDDLAEIKFHRLQKIFKKANDNGLKGLSLEEFKKAIGSTVGLNFTDDQLETLFMRVDSNCDGAVDWEEYVTFILLEYEKDFMAETIRDRPFPNDFREIYSRHRDTIVRIAFYPNVRKSSTNMLKIDYSKGKYVTLSKEGVLSIWTLDMVHLKTYNTVYNRDRATLPWFTDMVVMYNVNMVAVASTEREILIYDLQSKKFLLRYYLIGLESCVTSMDYWANPSDFNRAVLIFGDTAGNIYVIRFENSLRGGPFGQPSQKKTVKQVSFPDVLRGLHTGVKVVKLSNVHDDWVGKVQYIPENDAFLSSSQSPKTSLYYGDLGGKRGSVYFLVNRGILCFDYSYMLNIIVTGGIDYAVRVWNPYVNNRAIGIFKNHNKPINHVMIHEKRGQVISIDKGRSLHVFDIRDQTCLQHISGRIIKLNQLPVSAVYFNPAMKAIILASNTLIILERPEEDQYMADVVSHNKPLVGALYNKTFKTLVSACQESAVSVWDINTGSKIMKFVNAHTRNEAGVEIPVEITSMVFDASERRLLTGARDGTVKIWNFNNGFCLQTFTLPDKSDVTGIVCTRLRIYVTGWGKAVHVYLDGGPEELRKSWKIHHKDDILSIAHITPNMIVTGSYDGNIIIWSLENGQINCRLNPFEDVKPIVDNMHINDRNQSIAPSPDGRRERRTQKTQDAEEEITSIWELAKLAANKTTHKLEQNHGLGLLLEHRGSTEDCHTSQDKTKEEITCKHPLLKALDKEIISNLPRNAARQCTREVYDKVCRRYDSAIEKILYLEARPTHEKDTAILFTTGTEGWVRAWSIELDGGLLGQFNASHQPGQSVHAMATDSKNNFLFTGDTQGYVEIWDIKDYCIHKQMTLAEKREHIENLKRKFSFFRMEMHEMHYKRITTSKILRHIFTNHPPPETSNPSITLRYPRLLSAYRAHILSINSIEFINERELIVTASADCSIRLWTIGGQYIGTFGVPWAPLPQEVTPHYFFKNVPKDVKRAGSARTLKVLNGGKTPLWQVAFNLLRERGVAWLKKQFDHLKTKEEKEELSLVSKVESKDIIQTSNILGKSYKRKVRHRLPPELPKLIKMSGTVAIYHTLRFADLAPLSDIQAPEFVREVHMRKIGTIAFNKLRGNKNKQNMPAIVGMYEKFLATPAGVVKRTKTGRMKKLVEKFRDSLSAGADFKFAEKPPIQTHVKPLKKIPDDTPVAIVTTGERVGLLEAAALEVEEMEQHDLELYTMDQSCIEDFADHSPSSGPALKKRHNLPRNR